jgi:hypothetical protein
MVTPLNVRLVITAVGRVAVPVNVGDAMGALVDWRSSISLLAAEKLLLTLRVVGLPLMGLVASIEDAISYSYVKLL